MIVATGVGSMPGTDAVAFDEALKTVLGSVPDLPYLPELPGRGPIGDLAGRGLAVVADLGADLQPAGWRLTDRSGIDHRRARSLLAQDLDALEEQTQGYEGRLKVQIAGPWTLGATVERPRGDRVLGDHGARRDLAQALAEGVGSHVADVRRRVSGADVLLQLDEPALPAVLAGRVPTASGLHRHRHVEPAEASAALAGVITAAHEAGATCLVHCCAPEVPVSLLTGAGADGVSVDLDVMPASSYDALGEVLESQALLHLGLVPPTRPATPLSDKQVTERALRFLDMLGLDPDTADSLAITPACGLAGAGAAWAREALDLCQKAATSLRG